MRPTEGGNRETPRSPAAPEGVGVGCSEGIPHVTTAPFLAPTLGQQKGQARQVQLQQRSPSNVTA